MSAGDAAVTGLRTILTTVSEGLPRLVVSDGFLRNRFQNAAADFP
jgi:hypothetical protein